MIDLARKLITQLILAPPGMCLVVNERMWWAIVDESLKEARRFPLSFYWKDSLSPSQYYWTDFSEPEDIEVMGTQIVEHA